MANYEKRFAPRKVELRQDGDKRTIVGYAAVFYRADDPGTQYELWEGVYERIMPGAFDRALGKKDVPAHDARGVFNHDGNYLLGRISAGTARLSVDDIGLRFEIDVPDTTAGRDLLVSLERGDVTGASFAFLPAKGGARWIDDGETEVRELLDLDLFDFGPVTYPAYEATSAGVRSGGEAEEIRASYAAWKDSSTRDSDIVNVSLAMERISR